MSQNRDNTDVRAFRRVLEKIHPTISGVQFTYLPHKESGHGEIQVWPARMSHHGGNGSTCRDLDHVDRELPGIKAHAMQEKDKIIFLGNGLSPAPLRIIENSLGKREGPIVVHDVFDYHALQEDFIRLANLCIQERAPHAYSHLSNIINALLAYESKSNIEFSKYHLGDGAVPNILQDAALIINSHGPPWSTLEEQLSMLKIEGSLYTHQDILNPVSLPHIKNEYHVKQNNPASPNPLKGYIITRLE